MTTARFANQLIATSLLAIFAATAGSAFAAESKFEKHHPRRDEVNDRLQHQNQRIRAEVKEGELTKNQARRLHRKDRHIRKEERAMARHDDGHITKSEQKTLNQQENTVSKQIGK